MITQGDYSEFVGRQVQHLLDDNPDAQAIVFANDDMAFSGYRVYEKRGHKVGKDLYEAKNTTRALSVERDMLPPLKSLILKWGLLAQWLY